MQLVRFINQCAIVVVHFWEVHVITDRSTPIVLSQGIVQQPQSSIVTSPYQQQFVNQQGNGNHLAYPHFQHSLNHHQTIQPPCHNQSDAERQQRIKELKDIVTNPKETITELVMGVFYQ